MRRAAVLLLLLSAGSLPAADDVGDRVLEALQSARDSAGAPRLSRRADLDAVASYRAERIARLSHAERLGDGAPLADDLSRFGVVWYRRVATHMEMVRGYERPEDGLVASWRGVASAWGKATAPDYDAVGIATRRAGDGWIVLVAVLLADLPARPEPAALEQAVLLAVNRERMARGLGALVVSSSLSSIAREHSLDMAERDYLSHVSPEGLGPADRVGRAGIEYTKVAENIHFSRHEPGDPAESAVRDWLESPGHRRTMLDPEVEQSGVGASVGADGSVYLTQLFLR